MTKTYYFFKKFLILIVFCTPLLAYSQTVYTGAQINEKVALQNKSASVIAINSLQSQLQNNALQVSANVTNNSGEKIHLYYRVLWLNDQKLQVSADSWKPALMLPNKSITINSNAPLSTASDFSIEFNVE